jgi:hypothetical protein
MGSERACLHACMHANVPACELPNPLLNQTPSHPPLSISEECDYIRLKAEKRLERSGVVDSGNGGSQVSDIRTSDGMFFSRAEDTILEGETLGRRRVYVCACMHACMCSTFVRHDSLSLSSDISHLTRAPPCQPSRGA